jgi:ATP-dependent Clp protease adaptor protein ClpS
MNTPHSDRAGSPHADGHPQAPSPVASRAADPFPQYKVILLQDPVNELPFIVRTVMELTRLCKDEATYKMWEAHHSGRSVLFRTYRERAELYVQVFAERGLTVTLEPA